MDERELQAQLSELLAAELADRIPVVNETMLGLERGPVDAGALQAMHRLLHVIKGASRSAGALAIEAACHELETAFATLSPGEPLPPALAAAGFAFADQLERARGQLLAGQPVSLDAPVEAEADSQMRVDSDDLDLLTEHNADVLRARQQLAASVGELHELRTALEGGAPTPSQLAAATRGLARVHRELARGLTGLDTAAKLLDEQLQRMRLRSIGDACQGLDRIVHDVALALGKQAALEVTGSEVRVDRAHVDALREVIVQLVRNAVVHGIEAPDVRAARGKPPIGRIEIEATAQGDAIHVVVRDDGGGLDLATIGRASVAEAHRAIFEPGFTTAAQVTEHAGRGVGLDVAKQRLEALHGAISVSSTTGQGTAFAIQLPTSFSTSLAVIVEAAGSTYAIPSSGVERVARLETTAVQRAEDRDLARIGGAWIPVDALDRILDESPGPRAADRILAVVLAQGERRAALVVDRVLGVRDLAIGALPGRLPQLRHVTGQARLPSGELVLVLNISHAIDDAIGGRAPLAVHPPAPARRYRILLADDSATTRALETNILRTAGYDVVSAIDGQDALAQLEHGAFDLIVSDVDMPNLDGFGLVRAVRALDGGPPVVLVTARATNEDRAKGLQVGASAYLVKSSFDQTLLLQTIERLL